MKATIKDFFGSNSEQEVLDEIIILPIAARNNNSGTITLPTGVKWGDFESIEIGMGIASNNIVYCTTVIPAEYLRNLPTSWVYDLTFADVAGTRWSLDINAISATTATWSGASTSATTCWPRYMIGYKRRISRVGIDELMSAMSLPNLIANADLTDNPINQRGFNGDWSSLAVGAYGYDQWMKVSSTHMGYVVEAGKYRPSTKHTLTKDDVVLGEFVSPASGHWIVSVPFATSGKFDLYAGQFKRPWHPVQDGDVRCKEYYSLNHGHYVSYGSSAASLQRTSCYFPEMRVSPTVTLSTISGTMTAAVGARQKSHVVLTFTSTSSSQEWYGSVKCDASITLAEVNGQITTIG